MAFTVRSRRFPLLSLLLLGVTLAALPFVGLLAYDNDDINRSMKGGPHRTINLLALKRFFTGPEADSTFRNYDFQHLRNLTGPGVVQPGMEPYIDCKEGSRDGTFLWWITEGGFTADEPELYAAFRHFYDPISLNGSHYLTDHLDSVDSVYKVMVGPFSKLNKGGSFNPRVDAVSWALTGSAGGGFGENTYCWERGKEYLRQAFASKDYNKDRLFAQAWRSLGETMHLVADMTSPAHVRNDSHPGVALGMAGYGNYNPNEGWLKADPYESFCNARLVSQSNGQPYAPMAEQIASCREPRDLFIALATFTQDNFFSSDTVAGERPDGSPIAPGNGLLPYPSPRISKEDLDPTTGYYVREVGGRKVRLAHDSWLSSTGWGAPLHSTRLSYPCIQDQASVLVPLGVAGAAKLLDLFVPKMELRLDNYDADRGILEGTLDIRAGEGFGSSLSYNSNPVQIFNLYKNGDLQNWDKVSLKVENNHIKADLSRLDIGDKDTLRLDLDVGGIRIRSEELGIGKSDFTGSFGGPIRGACVNRNFILKRYMRPGNTEMDQIVNEAERFSNQNYLKNLEWAGLGKEGHIWLHFLDVQKNSGEAYAINGKVFIETKIEGGGIPFTAARPYKDKRHGDVRLEISGNRFHYTNIMKETHNTIASTVVREIWGTLNGKRIQGEWSVKEDGTLTFRGSFSATKEF